jgi:hypothetical protein
MRYAVEMVSDGMIYIPSFLKIGSRIRVILKLLSRQSETLRCWYYEWEGFVIYAIQMTPDYMTDTYQVL